MKRIFSVRVKKTNDPVGLFGARYEVVATTASAAIDKAIARFNKEKDWGGSVLVEQVTHRGPAL